MTGERCHMADVCLNYNPTDSCTELARQAMESGCFDAGNIPGQEDE